MMRCWDDGVMLCDVMPLASRSLRGSHLSRPTRTRFKKMNFDAVGLQER